MSRRGLLAVGAGLLCLVVCEFGAALAADTPTQTQISYCRRAEQMRNTNLPANDASAATDIVHSSVVYYGEAFAGIVYITRNGHVFYQNGLINPIGAPAANGEAERNVADALIPTKDVREGTIYALSADKVSSLVGAGMLLAGCY